MVHSLDHKNTARLVVLVCLLLAGGCRSHGDFLCSGSADQYQAVATQIEYPDTCEEPSSDLLNTAPPHTVRNPSDHEPWELSLEEVIHITLANSPVMRDLGGRVITAPATVPSIYDPAITETDPLRGTEAALSEFDAQLNAAILFNRSERAFNNAFFGGGANKVAANTGDFEASFSKTAATGTQFAFRNITAYNRNDIPVGPMGQLFHSAYDTVFSAEVRQPLLQGAGIAFNRIAGPNAQPGVYNGVLLGRINTDISLADFEAAVIGLVSDVETTYWQLYFAYRDLDAKIARRDATLQTWRAVRNQLETGFADGEREALAREQYYAAKAEVENALNGTPFSGLTVTTAGGVFTVERQLRYLMGIAASDGRLIRPADSPAAVDVAFDWQDSIAEALVRRVELRRQRWAIRRSELELVAARNFRLMRLDLLAQYRWRGFGDQLLGQDDIPNGSAFSDLFDGDLQGWQLGLELSTPVGNRIGHTAIRNAELKLARERAVVRDQELRVVDELSSAFAEVDRTYTVSRTNYNRKIAAYRQLAAIRAKYETGTVLLEQVVDAEQRATEADSNYYRALVDHNLAIARLHKSRGSLLEYYDIYLAEGPWSEEHHISAAKQARRFHTTLTNYCFSCPSDVSQGEYPQEMQRDGATGELELLESPPMESSPNESPTPPVELPMVEPTRAEPSSSQQPSPAAEIIQPPTKGPPSRDVPETAPLAGGNEPPQRLPTVAGG